MYHCFLQVKLFLAVTVGGGPTPKALWDLDIVMRKIIFLNVNPIVLISPNSSNLGAALNNSVCSVLSGLPT